MDNNIIIERRPLEVSPTSRVNSYNHHSLAPWLDETGYLTPLYMHRRHKALEPFNMAQWLTPNIQAQLLQQPALIIDFTYAQVTTLLEVAATCDRDHCKAAQSPALCELARELDRPSHQNSIGATSDSSSSLLPFTCEGYFVRMSHCSPKDVDHGVLRKVQTVFDALVKIVCSKRTIEALLTLHLKRKDGSMRDARLYFFPYMTTLDRASEWRCFVRGGRVVGISPSKFYTRAYPGITDEALVRLARKCRELWAIVGAEVQFDTCALDVYAEVTKNEFDVRLIEINPGEAHLGTGSLLFHWIDDQGLMEGRSNGENSTVVRVVEEAAVGSSGSDDKPVNWAAAVDIGRKGFELQELQSLQQRALLRVLDPKQHAYFKALLDPATGLAGRFCTKAGGLRIIREAMDAKARGTAAQATTSVAVEDHPRWKKVRAAFEKKIQADPDWLRRQAACFPDKCP